MASLHVSKDGVRYAVDEKATGAEVKRILKLPQDSILVNERNEQIANNESIGSKVRDGEAIASYPSFKYW